MKTLHTFVKNTLIQLGILAALLLTANKANAEYFSYTHKWAKNQNQVIQFKARSYDSVFLDLKFENVLYNEKSDIKIDRRKIGLSYGWDLSAIKIYTGANYTFQQSEEVPFFKWPEFYSSIHYKVENYRFYLDASYYHPLQEKKETNGANIQDPRFNLAINYELINGWHIRAEKTINTNDYHLGVIKWF